MATIISRAEHQAQLLASLPTTISIAKTAELFGSHRKTIQDLNRSGKLPFRNVSLTRRTVQFLAVDVVNWLFAQSAGESCAPPAPRRGRPIGSRNKAVTLADAKAAAQTQVEA